MAELTRGELLDEAHIGGTALAATQLLRKAALSVLASR